MAAITLEQLLSAREARVAKQQRLVDKFRAPLICFTLNIPGPDKNLPACSSIFYQGCQGVIRHFTQRDYFLLHFAVEELDTGFEGYFVVDGNSRDVKVVTIEIENQHPLGRIFDLDVIALDGLAVSRASLGHGNRKCLFCAEDAHGCSRSAKHDTQLLINMIEEMAAPYLTGKR